MYQTVFTVTFKCVGSVSDIACQEALHIARDRLQEGFTVQDNLFLNPTMYMQLHSRTDSGSKLDII